MELNEEEVGDHEIEVLDLDLEVAEEVGVMDTPVVDVLGSGGVFEDGNDGNAATTPLRCVVESDEGAYKDLLDHPQVGMVFSSWEDADKFYRKYGKQRGFGVYRAAGNFKIENGKTDKSKRRSYIWHCECAGKADLRRRVNEKRVYGGGLSLDLNRRKTKKCGCPVEMRAVCKPDGCWEVRKAITAHVNHNPTPRKSRYISMYRQEEIINAVRRRLFNDCSAGTQVTQVHRSLAKERGGVENMALTERDLRNVLAREKKLQMMRGYANAMLAYFDKMCSVSNENTETFEWLFSNWLDCMGGKQPVGFLTDQCAAMRKALSNVMPNARHRWCLWHIVNKFGTNLGSYANNQEFHDDLLNVIYDSLNEDEFELNWTLAMESYGLVMDEWLLVLDISVDVHPQISVEISGLYEERHMWIPAYMKHLIWAGMKTTQRSESIYSFFDKYVKRDTRLYQFVERYCDAMENRANAKKEANANSAMRTRHAITSFAYEKAFQNVYTDAKFVEIQEQCTRLMYLSVVGKMEVSDSVVEHLVQDRVWFFDKVLRKEIPMDRKIVYSVTFNSETNDAFCECKLFECHGIMCSHQFKVFDDNGVKEAFKIYIEVVA
ncbi:protein FAR1-RELATED SEQUENCE 1-like [Chenopodium quinoa]|uniref:protein FAR1-RELATED SEQUENCE 1-like n=1 Tax=Chenopodium quinoa TaxID=63459 RepID=UPI000B7999AD|nr:protein FAR1-RELATED SEQUENCE 1-like [Chenopodium quinoa]